MELKSFFGGSNEPRHQSINNSISGSKELDSETSMNNFLRINVADTRKLEDLQADFNACFTFLKIEFFKSPHKIGEGSAKSLIYDKKRLVRDCRVRHVDGIIQIDENMTVNSLEEQFLKDFGLSVQVFRKSGNVWLETSATDSWSLRQQNDEGAELSKEMKADKSGNYEDSKDIN